MSEFKKEIHANCEGGRHLSGKTARSSVFSKLLAVLLLFCVTGGIFAVSAGASASAEERQILSPADIYEQNVNSTVGITIQGQISSRYGGYQTYAASGSGFIISEEGYILTNYHVIENSDTVTVATYDNETYDAEVIGYDESNDIAILKIEAENLVPVTLGDSDSLRVGDTVLAIGNPLGELTFSLTRGIVSALSRSVTVESGTTMTLIQTDCAINSGNSGGALFNEYGEVIGITNAKYSSSALSGEASIDNIGFAIPLNSVRRIFSSIIENGYIVKPYIGVSVSSVSEETASITGLKNGAWVREVTEDAPAAKAGIQVNDVIVKVDDVDITSSEDLVRVISGAEDGQVMKFSVYRQGKEIEIDVTIEQKTESALKNEEEAETEDAEDTPQKEQQAPQGQPNQPGGNYYGFGNPMEDFFDYFFNYGF